MVLHIYFNGAFGGYLGEFEEDLLDTIWDNEEE